MILRDQYYEIYNITPMPLRAIEKAGRTCYQSKCKPSASAMKLFVHRLNTNKHHAMIEFADMTVVFTTDTGVTHELVRHRLCSFAQESTRYVRYGRNDMEFIRPIWCNLECREYTIGETTGFSSMPTAAEVEFLELCLAAERAYSNIITEGRKPEDARAVLPKSLKTEIVVKANLREWQHIFNLRCSPKAHPQIRALLTPLREEMMRDLPEIFGENK